MKKLILAIFLGLSGCQTSPHGHVTLGNNRPGDHCKEVGQVIGTSGSRKNSKEKAMDDLKHEASLISADYVRVLAVSAHGAAVRGIAYRCQ